ncbi:MAG: hypothetical protein QXU98_08860 [Candidatus Parvarchaeota archaeon]
MIPGTGETAFKRYQEQVHNQIEEPVRRKIEKFMDHCCMDADGITDDDVEMLKEMAGLMDPSGDRGLLERIEKMDTGVHGLKDRQTALTAKGIIEGYIRSTWYDENRPTSTTADAISSGIERIQRTSYEEYAKEHPDIARGSAPSLADENILKKISDLEKVISDLREENEKVKSEIMEIRAAKEMIIPHSMSAAPEKKPAPAKEAAFLDFSTDDYFRVVVKEDETLDVTFNVEYPKDYAGYQYLRMYIENEKNRRRVALNEFQVHVRDKESYDVLFSRIKSVVSEFLSQRSVKTDIRISEEYDDGMSFYPKLENGAVWRIGIGKVDARHFEGDGFVVISLGQSYIRYEVVMGKEYLPRFVDDLSDLIELILKSGEKEETKAA